MKKQELIHLHGLLAEVSNNYEEYNKISLDYSEYENLGVRPTSIHKSKTDHKAAVFALANCITTDLDEEDTEAVPATAD
ncbi:UPF0058 family protein [Natronoarchaeum sp. GCM10025703]|uniref:UPF0058 family protein n=1 Tax=unclassified Natronoarchaeum TaxID=2620183 RepID=UPI0036095530